MFRPIDGDVTSRDSKGSPSREYAAAVGVSTEIMARTGTSAPRTTTQIRPSHGFTIGKLAVTRGRFVHCARRLISLLSKRVDRRGCGSPGVILVTCQAGPRRSPQRFSHSRVLRVAPSDAKKRRRTT